MFRVDIYTAVKSSSNSKTMGKYGFVCTCAKKSGGIGKIQDTGHLKGTRHETEVKAITEALSRLNQSCEVYIHCEDTYVVNIIDIFLPGWAGNGFKTLLKIQKLAGHGGGTPTAAEMQSAENEKLKKAIERMNEQLPNSEAKFGIHEATNRVMIKLVDKDTQEVIKEIPPEKTLDMLAKSMEIAGVLLDQKL